jgi:hypothetical protein
MEHWEIEMIKAKKAQEIKRKYPDVGKIVKFKGEYGVVIFDPNFNFEDEYPEYKPGSYSDAYAVRWDTKKEFDLEQYFFDYEYLDSYEFKYINMDGSLRDEFKEELSKKKKKK